MYYIVWQFIIECTVCKKKKCKLSHSVLLMFTQHPNFLGSRVIQRLKYMRDPVNKDVESNNSSWGFTCKELLSYKSSGSEGKSGVDTLSSVYVVPSADDKVGHPQQSFFPLCTLDSSCLSQIMDCKSFII